ncbi:hypothetical protein HK098_000314 [Nowakowskiella sp. JEL0407]|nr:hypothetical protein HK098_000314 [Nowakowskiella sp. JEL0407]
MPKTSPSADNLPLNQRLSVSNSTSNSFPINFEVKPFEAVLENERPWTSKDIGHNAISGILNDPMSQSRVGPKPLKGMENIPPVPQAMIRKVRDTEFDPYRKLIHDVYDRYQYNRAIGLTTALEGLPILNVGSETEPQSFLDLLEAAEKIGYSDPSVAKSQRDKLDHKQRTKLLSANCPELSIVPPVFFENDFNLGNPHIFDLVCQNTDITSTNSPDAAKTNIAIQEKISHYLETVEIHLIREISRRSSSFFAALTTLQNLHQETLDCVTQIQDLRSKLDTLNVSDSKKGLEVVRLKRRRGNLGLLYGSVKLVSEVRQTQPMIQILLSQGDYSAALDLIDQTSLILKGKGSEDEITTETFKNGITFIQSNSIIPRSLDLRGVRALQNLNIQLLEMSATTGKMLETDFVNLILTDLRETVDQMDKTTFISPKIQKSMTSTWIKNLTSGKYTLSASTPTGPLPHSLLPSEEEHLKRRLTPLILGLLRIDRINIALQTLKESLILEIKVMSKKYYPHYEPLPETATKQDHQSALSKQLQKMSFDSYFNLMISVYVTILHILQRVSVISEVCGAILTDAKTNFVAIGSNSESRLSLSPSQPTKTINPSPIGKRAQDDDIGSLDLLHLPGDDTFKLLSNSKSMDLDSATTYPQIIQENSDLIFAVIDASHVRCAKLLGVRSDQNSQLNPKDFYRLFGATWEFVVAGESLGGRLIVGLKSTILNQAKSFLAHFHEEKTKQIALLIENEQWMQIEVPIDFQNLAGQLVNQSNSTNPANSTSSSLSDLERNSTTSMQEDEAEEQTGTQIPRKSIDHVDGKSSKCLVLGKERYFVVNCVLAFLKMLTEYMQCVENIPTLTTDILNRVSEIIKLFNSRVCQVILGAGAMRSAGLKNITARHIALAAQSLGVVIALIPHIRSALQKHMPIKQQVLLNDFDRLLRDFRDHQNELYLKLVSIMNERLAVHCRTLQTTNWDNVESNNDEASPYMALLVKETTTLHKVLSKFLTPDTLKMVISEVFKSYTTKIEEDLKKVEIYSSSGKNRLLIDMQYFTEKLSELEGVDGPGDHLENAARNLKIRDKRERAAALAAAAVLASTNQGMSAAQAAQAAVLAANSVGVNAGSISYGQKPNVATNRPSIDSPQIFNGVIVGGRPSTQISRQSTESTNTTASGSVPTTASTSAAQSQAPPPPPKSNFSTAFGKMLRSQNQNLGLSTNSKSTGNNPES